MKANKKKILFIPFRRDLSIGSHRIWINDYCTYLNNLGIDSKITYELSDKEIEEYDIFILGKGAIEKSRNIIENINRKYPNKIVGAITPPRNLTDIPYDFVMAGSLEEADSLSFHNNVIVNAHIESLFYKSKPKIHEHKERLKICVHGWTAHLAAFSPNLTWALEEFEREQDIELVIISEKTSLADWKIGRPNIKNISVKQWDFNTIKPDIQDCDIGLVPGIHDLTHKMEIVNPEIGLFETDYIFRIKNKCNNGRSIAFFQLGIPVIVDFTPSHLHMLGDTECGYLAHSKHGWLRALRILKDSKMRSQISKNALEKVNLEYNPNIWARRYYESLCKIYDRKQ